MNPRRLSKQTEGEKDYYEGLYSNYQTGSGSCPTAVHDLRRAKQIVEGAIKAFDIQLVPGRNRVLDLGCGLGYCAAWFARLGGDVTAWDRSAAGVDYVRSQFTDVHAECVSFPDDHPTAQKFDVIWLKDYGGLNLLTTDEMDRTVFGPLVELLRPGGVVVVGWRSDFTNGFDRGNWANWSFEFIGEMKQRFKLRGPCLVELPRVLSPLLLRTGKLIGRKMPFYLATRPRIE